MTITEPEGEDVSEGTPRPPERRCYMEGCMATWKHWHGFLPGGYDNPVDPEGMPILFDGPEPELPPGWCRDYNGAPLRPIAAYLSEVPSDG
jgi:hypothetical protein